MAILSTGLLLLAASLFVALFRMTRIPDILLLILIGIALGPTTGHVDPADFGKVGQVMGTIALTVILFEGGLSLSVAELRRALGATSRVTLLAFLGTMAIFGTCGHWVLGLPWALALTLGAVLGGTSSAVVIPLVRQLPLGQVPATVLVLESALTDVLTIVLAAAFLVAYVSGQSGPMDIAWGIVTTLASAALVGAIAGVFFMLAVRLIQRMPSAMVGIIGIVLVTYGVAERLGTSGAIAVLTLGFVIRNAVTFGMARLPFLAHVASLRETPYVNRFLVDVIFVLKTFFFVHLGISLRFGGWRLAGLAVVAVVAAYALRALIVRLTMAASTSRWDASVMAVMGPKGLAAAVLAGAPLQQGIAEGLVMQQFTYLVVLVSIVATSVLVPQLAWGPVGGLMRGLFGSFAAPVLGGRSEATEIAS